MGAIESPLDYAWDQLDLYIKCNIHVILEASRGAVAPSVAVKPTGCGFILTRGFEMFTYIYISISSLWCRG